MYCFNIEKGTALQQRGKLPAYLGCSGAGSDFQREERLCFAREQPMWEKLGRDGPRDLQWQCRTGFLQGKPETCQNISEKQWEDVFLVSIKLDPSLVGWAVCDNNIQLTSLWLKLVRNGPLGSMWARAMREQKGKTSDRDYLIEMGTVSKLTPIAYINQ